MKKYGKYVVIGMLLICIGAVVMGFFIKEESQEPINYCLPDTKELKLPEVCPKIYGNRCA